MLQQQAQPKPDAGSNYSSKMGQKTIIRVRENNKAVERQEKVRTLSDCLMGHDLRDRVLCPTNTRSSPTGSISY
jgi:hypothetical protein